jgi:hypothetical protein
LAASRSGRRKEIGIDGSRIGYPLDLLPIDGRLEQTLPSDITAFRAGPRAVFKKMSKVGSRAFFGSPQEHYFATEQD